MTRLATRLAIVIVNFNAKSDLDVCLTSLHAHPMRTRHEIVIVDNASTDGSLEMLRARWPRLRAIASPVNAGFARANNLAIRETESELILLLNSDTIVPAGAIDRLVAALERDPSAAVAGPRLVDAQGRTELSFGRMMGPFNEARQKLLGKVLARRKPIPGASAYARRLLSQPGTPDWVSGACLLVRRADAESVGLLDERFFMYTEDIDFCAAIRARGRKVLFVPDVEVVHLRGRSRQTVPAATQAAYRRSHVAFYDKHHPAWAPWLRRYLRWRGQLPTDAG
jgi:N-acetylglucosaminyl-diphospho-decaprenol L-rhamnosyltransferase